MFSSVPKAATRSRLLAATRELLVAGAAPTAGAVAARAGVSRLTVYQHFGSQPGLLAAVAAEAAGRQVDAPTDDPVARLRGLIAGACSRWAADPALFRRLPAATEAAGGEAVHALASAL